MLMCIMVFFISQTRALRDLFSSLNIRRQKESPAWLKQLLSLDVTGALLCNIECHACWPESFITWVFLFLGDLLITCLYNVSTIYVLKSEYKMS